MKVLIVDDHALFRQGLVSLLHAEPDFEVCGQAGTIAEAIEVAGKTQPEMILMDYVLPDGNGAEAARIILKENPTCLIVFLTIHVSDEELFDAIRSGAKGYFLKSEPVNTLVKNLHEIQAGNAVLSPAITSIVLEQIEHQWGESSQQNQTLTKLTPRELEVLRELETGASNKEIAKQLFMAENTVKRHVHNILTKLDMPNRRAAAQWARQQHL
ncbi:MAG: response regulator [Candidatus Promineifilaceae bacterium]|jgi:two-component system NarL family response regulator